MRAHIPCPGHSLGLGQSFFLSRNRVKTLDELSKGLGDLGVMSQKAGGPLRSPRWPTGEQPIAPLLTRSPPKQSRVGGSGRHLPGQGLDDRQRASEAASGPIISADEEPHDDHEGRVGNRLVSAPDSNRFPHLPAPVATHETATKTAKNLPHPGTTPRFPLQPALT